MEKSVWKVCILACLVSISTQQEAIAGPATGIQKKVSPKIPTDATCDQNFIDAYFSKKECLFGANSDQCEKLAIMHQLQIAGAGAGMGAMAGKVFESYLSKDLKFSKNFEKAVGEIKKAQGLYHDIHEKYKLLENEAVKAESNGEFKTYADYRQAWRDDKIPTKNMRNVHDAAEKNFRELIKSESDSAKKQAMQARLLWDTGAVHAQNTIRAEIAKLFPQEWNFLKPFYDEMAKIERELVDAKRSLRPSEDGSAMLKLNNRYLDKLDGIKAKLVDALKAQSQNMKLVNLMASQGFETGHIPSVEAAMNQMAKDINQPDKLAKGAKIAIAKGAIGGIATGIALTQTGAYIKQKYISFYLNKCKHNIGLSGDEVAFLDSYNVWNDQNIVYQGSEIINLDCNKLNFNMSASALADAQTKFSGVPSGICQMMKKESDSIDKLFGGRTSKIDCDKNGYLNKATKLGLFEIIEFSSQDSKMGWDSRTNWPFTFFIDSRSNQANPEQVTRLPCAVDPTRSDDENMKCAEKQIAACYGKVDRNCKLVADAAKARVGAILTAQICPTNNGNSEATGSQSYQTPAGP